MLDKEAIRQNADLLVVAEELGVDIYRRGSKSLIYCPCHNDKNLGSCFINDKEFYCYSCHAKGDVFRFVQAVMNVGFPQALRIVADICGGAERYELPEDEEIQHYDALHFISKKSQDLIGLQNRPVYVHAGVTYDYEEAIALRRDGYLVEEELDKDDNFLCYSIQKKADNNPLYRLYKEDKELYRELVDDFCQRTIDKYLSVLDILRDPSRLPEEYQGAIRKVKSMCSDMEMASVISGIIKEVREISLTHGAGRAAGFHSNDEETNATIPRPANAGILTAAADSIWNSKSEAPF